MIKVMIVDDQELIRHSLKIILGVNNDMEVVGMAADGAETLQKLKELSPEERPDVILMDIRMPEMDGLEATRRIRAMDREDAKTIPIIALTANAFDEDVQRSMQAGLNAHLSKPVQPELLYETLESLIPE